MSDMVKITVSKSKIGNLKHHIFKFKNEEPPMSAANIINNCTSIAILNEETENSITKRFNGIELSVSYELDKSCILFSMYEFLSIDCDIEVKLIKINNTCLKYKFRYSNGSIKYASLNGYAITDEEINSVFKIISNKKINCTLKDVEKAYVSFDSLVMQYLDEDIDGIFKPEIKMLTNNNEKIFYIDNNNMINIYNYIIIAESKDLKYSLNTMNKMIEIKEPIDTLALEVVSYDEDKSINYKEVFKIHDDIRINITDLTSNKIECFDKEDISFDDFLIRQKKERTIILNNIFHAAFGERLERKVGTMKFRVIKDTNGTLIYGQESDDLNIYDRPIIKVDYMEVYYKDVTGLSNDEKNIPIPRSENSEHMLKKYSRKLDSIPVSTINKKCTEIENSLLEIIPDDTSKLFLEIKHQAMITKSYNYTVYLIDEKGKVSVPIVKVG